MDNNDICNIQVISYGVLGSLLIISEILGVVSHVRANSIIHFLYLTVKHLLSKQNIDSSAVFESLQEALIDEKKDSIDNNSNV